MVLLLNPSLYVIPITYCLIDNLLGLCDAGKVPRDVKINDVCPDIREPCTHSLLPSIDRAKLSLIAMHFSHARLYLRHIQSRASR